MVMRIPGAKCMLRRLTRCDAPSLAYDGDDREIWLNLRDRFPHPYTEDAANMFIAFASRQEPELIFGIEVDEAIVGVISLIPGHDIERVSCELGYWLGRAYWGRGIAVDAVSLL